MKSRNQTIIAAVLLFASGVVSANEPAYQMRETYIEAGYLPLAIHFPYNVKLEPKLLRFTLGANFNEYLALEGMVGATTDSDKSVRSTIGGLFIKPKVTITEDSTVFMRVGPARTSLYGSASGSLTRLAYGFGLQTKISDNLHLQVDYMHYGSDNSYKSVRGGTISLGMTY